MEHAGILRVVVASPGDVQPERDLVRSVANEVNHLLGRDLEIWLDVYGWEIDAYPGFDEEGPQGLIDPLLKIEDSDLFVLIFWKRFGTPVKDARSGAEHEFRVAFKAWKANGRPQIMPYFRRQPEGLDDEQSRRVLKFQREFPKEGLWGVYEHEAEFKDLLRSHLAEFVRHHASLHRGPRHQLPPAPGDFVGREAEIAELRTAMQQGGVTISGLQGRGGVGKTVLALRVAEELAPNYPDAQIYLDMKGVSEKPLTSSEAMAFVIRAWNRDYTPPARMAELEADYHSALHGKCALLLMDNARDAAQVSPLIPPMGSALLVTSRLHFALPGLKALNLNTLPPDHAMTLLLNIANRIGSQAGTIAKLCGFLPLALRLAASALVEHPDLATADYAARLADEEERLKLLQGGDQSVAASIGLSYNLLDAEMQNRWRMLAVFPDTFDAAAAATVWQVEADAAQGTLSSLLRYSLLEWNEAPMGEPQRAIEFYEQALTIQRKIGDRHWEGTALWGMSLETEKLGQRDQAITQAESALKIYEQIEEPGAAKVRRQLDEWRGPKA